MTFEIKPHTKTDKSFIVKGGEELYMKVAYDDVAHEKVDAEATIMVEILNNHWDAPYYQEKRKALQRVLMIKAWNEDKWLQKDFPTIEEYLNEMI